VAEQQATRDGQGALASMDYARARADQRFMRRFAASGPGSWMFARVLHHIDRPIYRLSGGRQTLATMLSGLPVVMLSTTGARSGRRRAVPVLGLPTSDGRGVMRPFRATVAEGEQRERIWQEGLRVYPGWSQYERRAGERKIAIFVLGEA